MIVFIVFLYHESWYLTTLFQPLINIVQYLLWDKFQKNNDQLTFIVIRTSQSIDSIIHNNVPILASQHLKDS